MFQSASRSNPSLFDISRLKTIIIFLAICEKVISKRAVCIFLSVRCLVYYFCDRKRVILKIEKCFSPVNKKSGKHKSVYRVTKIYKTQNSGIKLMNEVSSAT